MRAESNRCIEASPDDYKLYPCVPGRKIIFLIFWPLETLGRASSFKVDTLKKRLKFGLGHQTVILLESYRLRKLYMYPTGKLDIQQLDFDHSLLVKELLGFGIPNALSLRFGPPTSIGEKPWFKLGSGMECSRVSNLAFSTDNYYKFDTACLIQVSSHAYVNPGASS